MLLLMHKVGKHVAAHGIVNQVGDNRRRDKDLQESDEEFFHVRGLFGQLSVFSDQLAVFSWCETASGKFKILILP
jgi:hypothetical protein